MYLKLGFWGEFQAPLCFSNEHKNYTSSKVHPHYMFRSRLLIHTFFRNICMLYKFYHIHKLQFLFALLKHLCYIAFYNNDNNNINLLCSLCQEMYRYTFIEKDYFRIKLLPSWRMLIARLFHGDVIHKRCISTNCCANLKPIYNQEVDIEKIAKILNVLSWHKKVEYGSEVGWILVTLSLQAVINDMCSNHLKDM